MQCNLIEIQPPAIHNSNVYFCYNIFLSLFIFLFVCVCFDHHYLDCYYLLSLGGNMSVWARVHLIICNISFEQIFFIAYCIYCYPFNDCLLFDKYVISYNEWKSYLGHKRVKCIWTIIYEIFEWNFSFQLFTHNQNDKKNKQTQNI